MLEIRELPRSTLSFVDWLDLQGVDVILEEKMSYRGPYWSGNIRVREPYSLNLFDHFYDSDKFYSSGKTYEAALEELKKGLMGSELRLYRIDTDIYTGEETRVDMALVVPIFEDKKEAISIDEQTHKVTVKAKKSWFSRD